MTTKRKPDPRTGVKLDLEILSRAVAETVGPGCIADEVTGTMIALERGNIERAQMCLLKCLWMIEGAANVVAASFRNVDPKASEQEALGAWKMLDQRAKICLHNLDKLPEELRDWKAAGG